MQSLLQTQRALLALVALYLSIRAASADNLYQSYCSPQNTGADSAPYYWQFQSNGQCYNHCNDLGSALAIVQGYNCWCSNYLPAKQVSVSECNLPCYGFPEEQCGSPSAKLFGYINLPRKPSGTLTPSKKAVQVSTIPPITRTVTSAKIVTRVSTETPKPLASQHHTRLSTKLEKSTLTAIRTTTASGSTVFVTSLATASANPSNDLPVEKQKPGGGLSSGAIAGIVIGVLLGVSFLALAFCFCWYRPRRKHQEANEVITSNPPQRESSVLSRVGLLGAASKQYAPRPLPKIRTSGFGGRDTGPNSQETISPMSQRRNSQPMFIDNRLNPNAMTQHPNASKSSVSTLQDNQDYSRPVLTIRNPDIYEGT